MKGKLLFYILLFSYLTSSFAQNTWTTKAPFPMGKRAGSDVFGIGNFGYVFGGIDTAGQAHNDLWLYDPLGDQWSQRASLPGPARYSAADCVIGTNAYIGTGFGGAAYYNDWWEYNSATNSWSQKADFPGAVRSTGISLTLNNKAYVGMGKGATWYDDWYEYDPGNNAWTQKASFPPGQRQSGVGFGIGSYGYVGLGSVNNSYSMNDMYRYDPSNDSWSAVSSYPTPAGIYAVGFFVISNKVFICGGYDYSNLHNECYEYDPATDNWTAIAGFGNVSPPRYFRGGFAIRGKGYLVGGSIDASLGTAGYRGDLIEYTSNYVGINETEENDYAVYYETSLHELIVSSALPTNGCVIFVYSESGALVGHFEMESSSVNHQSLQVAPGVYFYRIENKSGSVSNGKFSVLN